MLSPYPQSRFYLYCYIRSMCFSSADPKRETLRCDWPLPGHLVQHGHIEEKDVIRGAPRDGRCLYAPPPTHTLRATDILVVALCVLRLQLCVAHTPFETRKRKCQGTAKEADLPGGRPEVFQTNYGEVFPCGDTGGPWDMDSTGADMYLVEENIPIY